MIEVHRFGDEKIENLDGFKKLDEGFSVVKGRLIKFK